MKKKSHNEFRPPAIILGCHKLALGVIRSLGEQNVPVIGAYYNDNDMGYVSRYITRRFKCPDPDENESGFIDFLIKLAGKNPDGLIIPSDDSTLMAVSKNKKEVEPFCRVSCSDWDITKKLLEKKYTYQLAEEAGIPAPRTMITADREEAFEFIEKIGYPFILKPSIGHKFFNAFRTKMLIIEDSKAFKEKQRIADEHNIEMMIQELVIGDDTHGVNYNSYFMTEDRFVEFTAQKQRLSPRRIGFPCVLVSAEIPEIKEYGRKLLRTIGYKGFSCMEFKKDARSGIYKLMEVNARQNLSTALSVTCGINFPYLTYMYEVFGEIPVLSNAYTKNVFWIDIERDVKELIVNRKQEHIPFSKFVRPYLQPHVFCVLSFKDLKPAIKRLRDAVGMSFKVLNMEKEEMTKRGSVIDLANRAEDKILIN